MGWWLLLWPMWHWSSKEPQELERNFSLWSVCRHQFVFHCISIFCWHIYMKSGKCIYSNSLGQKPRNAKATTPATSSLLLDRLMTDPTWLWVPLDKFMCLLSILAESFGHNSSDTWAYCADM
jgi:hypothetical protein